MPDKRAIAILEGLGAQGRREVIEFLVTYRGMTPISAEHGLANATFAELDRVLVEMKLMAAANEHTYEYRPYE